MSRARGGHVLATVLFTDIVDSSQLATELGDRRWRVLLARHHTLVRKELKRYHGREIDNAGDGFFASFGDQVNAIRCASAISVDVKALGIDIRAGLHVGQAEVLGKKLGGVVVHTGARIMSESNPGEVLVSSILKDLVPGSDFTFVNRGTHRLKGIDGNWNLFAVTAVDGIARPGPSDPLEAARLREGIEPPPLIERRSGRVGIAILAVALAIVVTFIAVKRPEPALAVQVQPNSLAKIDTKTNAIVSDIPVAAPGGSQLTAVPPDEIWVLSQEKQVISVVKTTTGEVTPVPAFGGVANSETYAGYGIVYAFGSVWVTGGHSELVEFSLNGTVFRKPLTIRGAPALLAQGFGHVWVAVHEVSRGATVDVRQRLVEVDSGSGRVVGSAKIEPALNGIGVGEGSVWVSSYTEGTISKIDPHTLKTHTFRVGERQPSAAGSGTFFEPGGPATVATGFGSVWVSDVKLGIVYRIDPATNKTQTRIHVGEPGSSFASDILAADGSMWVASPTSKTVVRIDPLTNEIEATIPFPYTPNGLAASAGAVWVTINP
jgi:class 3 adenylate cyclase/streptogramin lyase